jgi:hypothetical protein
MGKVERSFAKGKKIFVGIDVHKKDWVVIVLCEGEEIYRGVEIPEPEALIRRIKSYEALEVHTV